MRLPKAGIATNKLKCKLCKKETVQACTDDNCPNFDPPSNKDHVDEIKQIEKTQMKKGNDAEASS